MFSALRPSTFKKTIKRLSGYAILKYGHYTGQAVRTCHPKIFSNTANLSDEDMAGEPDRAKYWCQAECKEMMAKKKGYT